MTRSDQILEALARGREDRQFFSRYFLGRTLHDTQLKYVDGADATVNVLATANRWGKTTVTLNIHAHAGIYKTGAEPFYLDELGDFDLGKFNRTRYNTIHTAGLWETAALVWEDFHKVHNESARLRAFVRAAPRSKPPHVDFITGARWKFRTLGDNASGIDGNSFYVITIDEAGWQNDLEEMMDNVIRVRVADVRGVIHLVGTFKPGVSKDFFKYAVRAAAHTGASISFDHRSETDDDVDVVQASQLDSSIRAYLREYGIELDELADALGGS